MKKPKTLSMRSVGKQNGKLVEIFYEIENYYFYPITRSRKTLIWGKGFVRGGKWLTFKETGKTIDQEHPLYQTPSSIPDSEELIGWLVCEKKTLSLVRVDLTACYYFTLNHAERMTWLDVPEKGEKPAKRENFYHPGYRWKYKKVQIPQ